MVHKLFEHDFWQNWLKFYDRMALPIPMRIIYNVKHRYTIHLKLEGKALTSFNPVDARRESQYLLYNQRTSTFVSS